MSNRIILVFFFFSCFFFFNHTATTEIYTLSLHDALPIWQGGDIILVDDPTSPKNAASETERDNANEWYKSTLYSRLNEPTKGVRIIIMQRVHEDDLSGYLLYHSPDKHKHICIPAELSPDLKPKNLEKFYQEGLFWKDRFSQAILDDYKSALGSYGYRSEERRVGKECRSRGGPDH